jgi:hypothetical protein
MGQACVGMEPVFPALVSRLTEMTQPP